jgi:hypothetical protein
VYEIQEKIKQDGQRVDVPEHTDTTFGGYLFKNDRGDVNSEDIIFGYPFWQAVFVYPQVDSVQKLPPYY